MYISYNEEDEVLVDNKLKYQNLLPQISWDIPNKDVKNEYLESHNVIGRILATEKPLKPGLRGITLFAHGRLVNAPEFFGVGESSHGYSYLTGWLNVDFIDELEKYYVQDYHAQTETQMEALTRVLKSLDPQKIAINISDHYAYTDGLSVGLYRQLMKELPKELTDRFVSSDDIGIRFLETRSSKELEIYPEVMKIALDIIESTFSKERIIPGKTTCRDLMDYMEQRVNDLGIVTWFESTIDLQRKDGMHGDDCVIERGDLLHCDFGIRYLNLCTDTQRLCYISKEDETELPAELVNAVGRNHRFQDIVRSNMKTGISGNDVFVHSIEMAKKEGLRPILYTHPLGFHGHAAGPTIGLFSNQHPIPVKGDLKLHNDTAYALELSIIEYLECYQRDTYIFTEESVVLKDNKVSFLASERKSIYMI